VFVLLNKDLLFEPLGILVLFIIRLLWYNLKYHRIMKLNKDVLTWVRKAF